MISFAGYDLTLDTKYKSLQTYLERLGHSAVPEVDELSRFGDYAWPSPVMLKSPSLPKLELNQYFYPVGLDRPGFGHFLITGEIKDALLALGSTFQYLVFNDQRAIDWTVSLTADPDNVIFYVQVISILPLFDVDEDASLYILTLADARFRDFYTSTKYGSRAGAAFGTYDDTAASGFDAGTAPTLESVISAETLSSKWAGPWPPNLPRNLFLEAQAGMVGRRGVWNPLASSGGCDVWSQAKDDALWAQVEPRLAVGGRSEVATLKRMLPSTIEVKFSGGHTESYTLTEVLDETSVGNGGTAAVIVDKEEFDADYAITVARNWLKNHLGSVDATINGITNLTLHPGVDYILLTHQADSCNTRIVKWGKSFQPNFSYSTEPSVYALGATAADSVFPSYVDLKDGADLDFTILPTGGAKYPVNSSGSPVLNPTDDWQLELPSAGLYEIDFRVNLHGGTTSPQSAGQIAVSLQVFTTPEGGVPEWVSTVMSERVVARTLVVPTHDITSAVFLFVNGGFSMRWLQELPGFKTGTDGLGTPTLKVEFTSTYASSASVSGWMSLTVTPASLRANSV